MASCGDDSFSGDSLGIGKLLGNSGPAVSLAATGLMTPIYIYIVGSESMTLRILPGSHNVPISDIA